MDRVKTKKFSENLEYIEEIFDIYSGTEQVRFNNRHPIYKTLLKIEFEDAMRQYVKKRNKN